MTTPEPPAQGHRIEVRTRPASNASRFEAPLTAPSPSEPGLIPRADGDSAVPDIAPAAAQTDATDRGPARRPARRAPIRARSTLPATSEVSETPGTTAAAPDRITESPVAGTADAPRPAGRSRPARRPAARPATASESPPEAQQAPETDALRAPIAMAPGAAPEFEPLPPPTKRKAPRTGLGIQRLAHVAENAVDWALGRTVAEPDETTVVEPPVSPLRRRRSRRGHRGRGGVEGAAGEDRGPDNVEVVASAPEPGPAPARPVPLRPAPSRPQAREERPSQLSTFESLVARQNVVLDALLAKVSSFASMEHALMAIERRLSSQGFGTAGSSAPRVGIFVDVPNIIYAAERIGVTIDFEKLLHMLTRGRELVRASAYAPISDDPMQRFDTQKFVQPFVRRGYRIVTKPLKRFSDGTMKGNFDVELAMDILMMADRLDVVSLISGDGDFSRLVEIVGSKGLRVEVVAFGSSTSSELRAICDDYLDISDYLSELT